MQRLVLTLKDDSKRDFFLELLAAFDFIKIEDTTPLQTESLGRFLREYADEVPPTMDFSDDLDKGYEAMAADREREADAFEWIEGTLNSEQL